MITFLTVITVCLSLSLGSSKTAGDDFDLFILTLHWPLTSCLGWPNIARGEQCGNSANAQWTVHGLWPNRYGEINPLFCNKSWLYEEQEMEPILAELEEFWPDHPMRKVEVGLWSHEWSKHGTCAVSSALESNITGQTEYFRTGCRLAAENPLSQWLSQAGVRPQDNAVYETREVWEAVMAGTGGFRPHIDCIKVEEEPLLSEIKLCYHRNLTRLDCQGIVGKYSEDSEMAGKCLRYSHFLYPASLSIPLSPSLVSSRLTSMVTLLSDFPPSVSRSSSPCGRDAVFLSLVTVALLALC